MCGPKSYEDYSCVSPGASPVVGSVNPENAPVLFSGSSLCPAFSYELEAEGPMPLGNLLYHELCPHLAFCTDVCVPVCHPSQQSSV